jgi:membrane protease YdiL (CAAX protease family)
MKENLFPNNIFQILGMLLLSILFAMPFFIFVHLNLSKNIELYQTVFFVLVCLIFIGISSLINYRRKQEFQWNFNILNIRILYSMLIIIFLFKIGINSPVNDILSHLLGNKSELIDPTENLYISLGALILAPILEEIIFRGIILRGLLTKYTHKFSIIISALIFGMVHGKPLQIWGAMIIGLFFGWIYYKTKSLGTTIFLHFFTNLIVLTHNYLTFNLIASRTTEPFNYILIIISSSILFLMSRQLILRMNK